MYKLHIGNKNYSSWSLRPWVLMKELGIPFEEIFHQFPPDRPSYPEFKEFSPSGLVPVLEDGDFKVWESLGIVEYLAEHHDGVWPDDPKARAWARSATAEMHGGFSALRNICGMNCGVRAKLHEVSPALHRDLARLEELWADGLLHFGGPFLAGETFTAVDAFFCPVAFRIQTYNPPMGEKAKAYAFRLLTLDPMLDWYKAALREDFREPNHEAETKASGEWTADYRAAVKA
ncbi:MAG: glutathione S-transferase family protein [Devosia sp.]